MEISDSEINELAVSSPQTTSLPQSTSPPIQPQTLVLAVAHSTSISSESNNSDTNNNSNLARNIANPIGTDEAVSSKQIVIDAEADEDKDAKDEDNEEFEARENVEDDKNSDYYKQVAKRCRTDYEDDYNTDEDKDAPLDKTKLLLIKKEKKLCEILLNPLSNKNSFTISNESRDLKY